MLKIAKIFNSFKSNDPIPYLVWSGDHSSSVNSFQAIIMVFVGIFY
jgi:hypothetical protein